MAIAVVASLWEQPGTNGGTTASIDTTGCTGIFIHAAYGPYTTATMSDSKSNTYSSAILIADDNGNRSNIFYCANPTVGTGHTFTISGTAIYATLKVLACSGTNTSQTPQTSSVKGSGVTIQPGSITPSENDMLVVTGLSSDVTFGTISPDSPFSSNYNAINDNGSTHKSNGSAREIQTTATARNPTWTYSSTSGYYKCCTMATFKASAAPATTILPQFIQHGLYAGSAA